MNNYSKDWISILRKYQSFDYESNNLVNYDINNFVLEEFRKKYQLDKFFSNNVFNMNILKIVRWIKILIPSDLQYGFINNESLSGMQLFEESIKTRKCLNCAGYAKVLNDILLSQNILSKCVWGLSYDMDDWECHVFNHVYNSQLQKWMIVDPAFGCCIVDQNNNFLNILELRYYINNNMSFFCRSSLNKNIDYDLTERYRKYIPKNVFMFGTFLKSGVNYNPENNQYCYIVPTEYIVKGYEQYVISNNIGLLF